MSFAIDFLVFIAGQEGRRFLLSHTVSLQSDSVSVVNDPVEDGVCDCWLADHLVPFGDGRLCGDRG